MIELVASAVALLLLACWVPDVVSALARRIGW